MIDELMAATGTSWPVIVIAQDYPKSDLFHGWTKKALPGSWLWKTLAPDDDDVLESYIRVSRAVDRAEIDPLLRSIADDEGEAGSCILTVPSLAWLYAPYAGGADVIAPTAHLRDVLRSEHTEWLSVHPSGL
ncbi:hypothetical protein V3W46_11350 [Subtercola sp. YIM 133946]